MNPFAKRFLIFVFGLAAAATSVFCLTAIAKYKPYGVPESQREKWDAIQAEIAEAERLRKLGAEGAKNTDNVPGENAELPKVAIDEKEHDFGMLDPGDSASHRFVIRNEGSGPLVLTAGETSCKCTLSEVSKQVVQPGDSGEVTLTWNTGVSREYYRQYAIIRTNDPNNKEIELGVTGRIKVYLDFGTKELLVPNLEPGQGLETTTVIYSQVLDSFDIADVSCPLSGFKFTSEPLLGEQLDLYQARSGWTLRVSSDASLDIGNFNEMMRVQVKTQSADAKDELVTKEIAIKGRVASPISFYGADLHSMEGLNLGVISDGKEHVSKLIVRVRGDNIPKEMVVTRIEPKILEAEIEALKSRPGVFTLTIRVPSNAPSTIFNREEEHGFVEIAAADDPSFKNWVPLYGAVVPIK